MSFFISDAKTRSPIRPKQEIFILSQNEEPISCTYLGGSSTDNYDLFEWLAYENLIAQTIPRHDLSAREIGYYLMLNCPHYRDAQGLIYATNKQAACLISCGLLQPHEITYTVKDLTTPYLLKNTAAPLKRHQQMRNISLIYCTPITPLRITTVKGTEYETATNSRIVKHRRF